ncbi:unnamed protein product [Absidia cylindrospora]
MICTQAQLADLTMLLATSSFVGQCVRHVTFLAFDLSDQALLALIQEVPLLTDLHVFGAHAITNECFQEVSRLVPHVTRLSLWNACITQRALRVMVLHWHHQLEQVEFIECHYLGDDVLLPLAVCAPTLENITLVRCHLNPDTACHARALTQLTSLRIAESVLDYTPFLTTLYDDVGPYPHLTRLSLESCHGMTDALAISILRSHPKLTFLKLTGAPQITDATLDAIGTYLPSISSVCVDQCPGISADGLRRLLTTCEWLDRVDCERCEISPDHFPDMDSQDQMETEFDYTDDDEMILEVIRLFGRAHVPCG